MLEAARPEISVVIPCRNEEENAGPIAEAVIKELEQDGSSFEIIFIDNHSNDQTVEVIRDLCSRDKRIKLIVNTRNFGQMCSPTHAIFQTRGRAVIGISADFEDPPELIPVFIQRWRAGAFIVLGVAEAEQVGPVHRAVRRLSYRLQRTFGDQAIVPNATGFGLYDAAVVRSIRSLREPEPFFRAMLVETGYPIETVAYRRRSRAAGSSNNNFFTLLDFALNGLANSSKNLLRAPLYVAFVSGLSDLFRVGRRARGSTCRLERSAVASGSRHARAVHAAVPVPWTDRRSNSANLRADKRGRRWLMEKERLNFTDG
jgi:glycosyltransferase involved in cell wall biosynthesis